VEGCGKNAEEILGQVGGIWSRKAALGEGAWKRADCGSCQCKAPTAKILRIHHGWDTSRYN
jgi:hypothetical protein